MPLVEIDFDINLGWEDERPDEEGSDVDDAARSVVVVVAVCLRVAALLAAVLLGWHFLA